MVIIDELIQYRRTLRSMDRSLLNQMLDNVQVAAFFETSDKKKHNVCVWTKKKYGQKCQIKQIRLFLVPALLMIS